MRQSKRVDGLPSDGPARRTRARYLSDDDPPLQTVVSADSPASETADPPLPSVAFQHDNFPPQPEAPQNIPDVPPQLVQASAASATSPQLPSTPPAAEDVPTQTRKVAETPQDAPVQHPSGVNPHSAAASSSASSALSSGFFRRAFPAVHASSAQATDQIQSDPAAVSTCAPMQLSLIHI